MSATYQLRHAGSPKSLDNLTAAHVADGLRDGRWEGIDEVRRTDESTWQTLENHPQFAELVEELEDLDSIRHEEPTHLDMTPLIDVCLVLLIFFILTTTYAIAVQKVVPIPAVSSDGKKARVIKVAEVKQRMVRVRVFKEGSGRPVVQIENTTRDVIDSEGKVDKEKLVEELGREAKGDVIRTEILLDARDISWGTFISIQDAARSAGIEKIHHVLKKRV